MRPLTSSEKRRSDRKPIAKDSTKSFARANTRPLFSFQNPPIQFLRNGMSGLEIGVLYENASRSLYAGSSSLESFWLDKLGSPQPWR